MKKWVERAAVLTGALGFVGVVIIFFNTISEHLTTKQQQTEKPVATVRIDEKSESANTETPKNFINTHPIASTKTLRKDAERINNKVVKPISIKNEVLKKPEHEIKKEPAPKRAKKLLSQEDLEDLHSAIRRQSNLYNGINCVAIRFLERGNNMEAVRQVEHFLTSKKLNIAGREGIEKSRAGIYVSRKGKCISVTIGKL